MNLAIVMPAYNEAACIERVVESWLAVFERVPGALFVVNDGSRDNTGEILDRLAARHANLRVIHQKNGGHGAAVLNGYRKAIESGAEYIFQTDSDDQFDREDFWKLWAMRETSPFILGNRRHRSDPFVRILISRTNMLLLLFLFGVRLTDANVPFRLMRADFLARILSLFPLSVFAPNIFCSLVAKKSGAKVVETGVTHRERKTGTVSILRWKLLKVCLRCASELISFRFALTARGSAITIPHPASPDGDPALAAPKPPTSTAGTRPAA